MRGDQIGIGIIGCGGFGLFSLQHFMQVPGVKLVAMAGTHREAAIAAGQRFGLSGVIEIEELVNRPEVDLVYIATPPFLHYEQAMAALRAGKHVLSEKPLAVTLQQGRKMVQTAKANGLMMVANLIQRYNPLAEKVRHLVESKVLGELMHAYFENYATDQGLPAEHWFWDRSKSGGIFIEHGVHFFDLFADWLGPGRMVAAQATKRPGTDLEEQVHCTVQYGDTVLVNFYHGFHQPARMDRQELRLLFERGDVTLFDWIPSRLRIQALADEAQTKQLCDLFPSARLDVTALYAGAERRCRGRGKPLDVYQMIEMSYGEGQLKMHTYGVVLRALLADQLAWIHDRSHQRRLTEENGLEALALAVEATGLAQTGKSES